MQENPFAVDESRVAEIEQKLAKIRVYLAEKGIDAVLISAHENIAWATAGVVDIRVGVLRESGVASLLVTRDGGAYYLTTNNEAPRLADEEFAGLPFQPVVNPWYANDVSASVAKIVGAGEVAGDIGQQGYKLLPLQPLRWQLVESELPRYRWLGEHAGQAAADVLKQYRPGMSEREFQALLAERLIERGILPSVYITAVDQRILKYRHAVPREGVLEHLGLLSFCARRCGLTVAMTRFVCFGALSAEMEQRFAVAAGVNARMLHATREGVRSDELFHAAEQAYAEMGFSGEEKLHHQGGATGYFEREWIARPGGGESVKSPQAFAWNPTVQGAKVEDTVLFRDGSFEVLTATPDLPTVTTFVDGGEYSSAGVLRM